MRIWSILFIKSDLKWCKHLSRSLYLYSDIDKYITLLCEKDKNCNIEKSEEVSDIKIPKMPRWCMQLVALLLSVYSASWKVHPGEFFLAYIVHVSHTCTVSRGDIYSSLDFFSSFEERPRVSNCLLPLVERTDRRITDRHTDGQTDRFRTKLSICADMRHRQHKN